MTSNSQLPPFTEELIAEYSGSVPSYINPAPPVLLAFARIFFSVFGKIFPGYSAKLSWKIFTTPRVRVHHKFQDELLKNAQQFGIPFSGMELKGYSWGDMAKPTVLLVHGFESRGTALRAFVPPLLQQGFSVATFDGPAHGDSPGKRIDVLSYGEAIYAAWKQVGEVEGIIAHSFGCKAASFLLANKANELALNRLVLISSGSNLQFALDHYSNLIHLPDRVRKGLYQIAEQRFGRPLNEIDVSKIGDKMQVEKRLLIHDRADDVIPVSKSEQIFAKWPDTKLVVTTGYGHYRIIKGKKVVDRVARFFKSDMQEKQQQNTFLI